MIPLKYPFSFSVAVRVGTLSDIGIKPGAPFLCGYSPVKRHSLEGWQTAIVTCALSMQMPSCANLSRFGVISSTGHPKHPIEL